MLPVNSHCTAPSSRLGSLQELSVLETVVLHENINEGNAAGNKLEGGWTSTSNLVKSSSSPVTISTISSLKDVSTSGEMNLTHSISLIPSSNEPLLLPPAAPATNEGFTNSSVTYETSVAGNSRKYKKFIERFEKKFGCDALNLRKIDCTVVDGLMKLNEQQTTNMMEILIKSKHEIKSVTSFIMGYIWSQVYELIRYNNVNKLRKDTNKTHVKKMTRILDKSGYPLTVSSSERFYGPPPDWQGSVPGDDSEIYIRNFAEDVLEDELILLLPKTSRIYSLKLMVVSGNPYQNRGVCFIKFFNRNEAEDAVKKLNNFTFQKNKLEVRLKMKNDGGNWIPATEYPILLNGRGHMCTKSDFNHLCDCVTEKLELVDTMMAQISDVWETSPLRIRTKAMEKSFLRFIVHSVLLELAEVDPVSIGNDIHANNIAATLNWENISTDDFDRIYGILNYRSSDAKIRTAITEIKHTYNQRVKTTNPINLPQLFDLFVGRRIPTIVESDAHPIIKAARIKFGLLKLHPYWDVNGKLSRLIFNSYLKTQGYPYISFLFNLNDRYYEAIQCARVRDDFTSLFLLSAELAVTSLSFFLNDLKN